jgi:hypothetical protein
MDSASEGELREYADLAKTGTAWTVDPRRLVPLTSLLPGGEGTALDRAREPELNLLDDIAAPYSGDTKSASGTGGGRSLGSVRCTSASGCRIYPPILSMGDYAEWPTDRVLVEHSTNVTALRYRTAALALLGRIDEARRAVDLLRAVNPEVPITRARRHIEIEMKNPFKRAGVAEAYYKGLRLAGLPE